MNAREPKTAKKVRMGALIARLKTTYPEAHCELVHADPFQLLIATILSAQCSDKQVNLVTPTLFKRFPRPRDFASAPIEEIERLIQRLGLFHNKAKSIQATCSAIVERFGGEVPDTLENLLTLKGVGRKTANVVLGDGFHKTSGVVVDTHVARLSVRLGLTRQTEPEKIEADLEDLTPKSDWTLLSHLLIWHGRKRCSARKPDCDGCELGALCPGQIKAKGARSVSVSM